jgi:two-component sensor histidine kinase/ABC-type amino acid transport substrate-binding protein
MTVFAVCQFWRDRSSREYMPGYLHNNRLARADLRISIVRQGIAVSLVAALFVWGFAAADAAVDASASLIVGSELDYPPFALSNQGSGDGFTVELWRAVAKEAGLDSVLRVAPFHEILRDFKNRKIDVLINLADSAERREFADFSVPHVTMRGAIFVRKGDKRIQTEGDLAGRSLIVIKADLVHDYARDRAWTHLVPVPTTADGIRLLASGRHDAMLVGKLVGLNTLKELQIKNIVAVGAPLGVSQRFAFAVQKGDASLLAKINDALASVRASGQYDDIYEKWFGSLDPPPLELKRYRWYIIAAAAVLVFVLLAYAWERRLRYRLNHSISLLNAAFESAADGILVVDQHNRTTYFNQQFLKMWQVPPELAATGDNAKLLQSVRDQLAEPEAFLAKVNAIYSQPEVESFDELTLRDGRVFERYSRPQLLGNATVGRVWSFCDVTERNRTEEQIKTSLKEKEVMLKEIHHRVKNNLQIISSLLYLQSTAVKDEETREVFRESRERVRSMALVHEQLYRSERWNAIDLGEHLKALADNVARGYGDAKRRVAMKMDLASMELDLDLAIPVSLIFNELLSNAYKHGFPGDRRGTVTVELSGMELDGWTLRVSDDGVGFPPQFHWETAPTLGLKIVRNLTEQIHGKIEVQPGPGASFQVWLPAHKARSEGVLP